MIQEFKVSNFHSIREMLSINFLPSASDNKMLDYYTVEVKPGLRLLKLGIIYGANASGKTTILEAISFFRDFMTRRPANKLSDTGFVPFMLDNVSRTENSFMELTFYIDGEKYILGCEFNEQLIHNERLVVYSSSRPTLLYERRYAPESDNATVTFGPKLGLSKADRQTIEGNTLNNCTVMAAIGQSNIETSRLDKVFRYLSTDILPTIYPGISVMDYVKLQLKESADRQIKAFLLQILKASDFNINDFRISSTDNSMTFQHSGDGGIFLLTENFESAGTKRFLGMAVILYRLLHQNCFLSIDEIETSIHYELFSYFIKLFLANSEGTSQLLMTTHDINLLDEDFMRRDTVWFTEKDSVGVTSVRRLSASGLHHTKSVYNAYRQGKLVELPFLGSIFLKPVQQ